MPDPDTAMSAPDPSTSIDPLVLIERLSRGYREGEHTRAVLKDLTLAVRRGEFIAILGRSGSGKSTLLNLIAGIDESAGGAVWIDGVNMTALTDRARTLLRRRRIGFVYQFFNLIPTLSVLENVLLPLELNGYRPDAAHARAQQTLQAVGIIGRDDAFPEHLSGGESQRVAIARAVVHKPALILADEPTGNLDTLTGQAIMRLLSDLVRRGNTTLILVTHDHDVAALADRRLWLAEGRLREMTTGEPPAETPP